MPLSLNEIKDRALAFSREWAGESSETAEAQTFWNDFFNVFGITRRRVASFQAPTRKSDGKGGSIDLLWKSVLLVEHKSRGLDLDSAYKQAFDYFPGLKERDLPRYMLVSDFARFRLHDLETGEKHNFLLSDLYRHIGIFGFISGYRAHPVLPQDPANVKAAELMGKLHDRLKAIGYEGHALEVYLVRLLFCLFAEDTGIFDEPGQFRDYIENKTAEDGGDLAHHLATLFHVLNTPKEKRLKNLDEHLAAFPYVNGKLFEEQLAPASFDSRMRQQLLDCCGMDWSRISPAIFGSLFQSVMKMKPRREIGAHYTTEQNILKVIRPLFLDGLWDEFNRIKGNRSRIIEFHRRLARMKFLDPACGCGNFLVIAYREMRLLELEILRELYRTQRSGFLDVSQIVFLDVDQFYGIEIEEFPVQIAQVALWMTDHQMNMRISKVFGKYFRRIPLMKSPNIVLGDALALDWAGVVKPSELSYMFGNPPYGGKHYQSKRQKADLVRTFKGLKSASDLDFVAAWYRKAAEFMEMNPAVAAAFVSTNSITQGEQVGILWPDLLSRGIKILFAHRTFKWSSEAPRKAAVHCVIIGFGLQERSNRRLFEYYDPDGEPHESIVANINPYLTNGPDLVVRKRARPLCKAPPMKYGNKPTDDGNFILGEKERAALISREPNARKFIRPYLGSEDFINGVKRFCIWLQGVEPKIIRTLPSISGRVEKVRAFRDASSAEPTKKAADNPAVFFYISQPSTAYLVVPEVSSERRRYIPIGFIEPKTICSNTNYLIPDATLYHFGVLTSTMHMAWTRAVCGRLESRYRYSASIVYNNFPWPEPKAKQRLSIEKAAQRVLNARALFPGNSMADLYDPLVMPLDLVRAHRALDKAVDAAYGRNGFKSEVDRVAFLFERYQALTSPLLPKIAAKNKRGGKGGTGKRKGGSDV